MHTAALSAGSLDFSFRVLHECETDPDFDHTAVRIHLDGQPCECQWECSEWCEDRLLAEIERRFPTAF